MNEEMSKKIDEKKKIYRDFVRNKSFEELLAIPGLLKQTKVSTEERKDKVICRGDIHI